MSGIPSLNPLWVDSLYLIFEICFAVEGCGRLFEVALDHLGSRVGPKSLKWVLGHFGSVRTGYMESNWALDEPDTGTKWVQTAQQNITSSKTLPQTNKSYNWISRSVLELY